MNDPLLKRVLTSLAVRVSIAGLLLGVAAGCAIQFGVLHEGPLFVEKKDKIDLSSDIQVRLGDLSRVELYIGGVHVGTIILDGVAGVYVGADPTQSAQVLVEFMALLNLVRPEEPKENYY